jgi:hypothetical protein
MVGGRRAKNDVPDARLNQSVRFIEAAALAGDEEHDFRLREKINLARIEFLDHGGRLAEPS